jgi:hypothetical protein
MKTTVYIYYSSYGSNKHDVLVIQVGGEPYDTVRNSHIMLDPHDKEFGTNLFHFISPYLSDDYEVKFIQSKK